MREPACKRRNSRSFRFGPARRKRSPSLGALVGQSVADEAISAGDRVHGVDEPVRVGFQQVAAGARFQRRGNDRGGAMSADKEDS
jgi:hypothetical protein